MRNQSTKIAVLFMLVVFLVGLLVSPVVFAETEPDTGTVVGVRTYTFYPSTALSSTTTTTYSSAPRTISGQDITNVKNWNSASVFVTADLGTVTSFVVKPQFSADQSGWDNAEYDYVANTLSSTTSVITSTGVTTATTTTSSSGTITSGDYTITMTSDGTELMVIPIQGEYMRFSMAYSGTVTPTIKVTLRNN